MSRPRKFAQGVPQGSPLSAQFYCLASASIPGAIKKRCPQALINQFADNLTIQLSSEKADTAAREIHPALDALGDWAKNNYVQISAEKREAMVISVDPREVNGKSQSPLFLNQMPVKYNKNLTILGTTIDSQLRFTDQMKASKTKLTRKNNMLKSL